MRYLVSGRMNLDIKIYNREKTRAQRARSGGRTTFPDLKDFFARGGVDFPTGAKIFFDHNNNRVTITSTIESIRQLERFVDDSNRTNGLNPAINKHLADLSPDRLRSKRKSVPPTPQKDEKVVASAAAAPSPKPPEAPSNQPVNPEYNGIPLSEILARAVVATSRCPVYDLSGGDGPLREAADSVNAKYADPKTNASLDAYRARFDALQSVAKEAHPARILGYVRPGFLFRDLAWKSTDSAAVFFPKSIGGREFGAVHWRDFASIGNRSCRQWWEGSTRGPLSAIPHTGLRTRFRPYPLTTQTVLFDPFEAEEIILSNTDHKMISGWIVRSLNVSLNKKLPRNNHPLAVVETRDGLFLGYLSEKGASGLSRITWEQALATKDAPFELKEVKSKKLKPGSVVLTLFDADTRTQTHIPSNDPKDFVLFPESYADLLKKGTWALKTSLSVPNDSGFEPLRELETEATFQYEIQKRLDRIKVVFDALDHDKLRLLVISESRVREVERKASGNGRESIAAKRWKRKKDQLTSEVALSGEGFALFTDGERIYQLAPGRMGKPELKIYEVKKNRLSGL